MIDNRKNYEKYVNKELKVKIVDNEQSYDIKSFKKELTKLIKDFPCDGIGWRKKRVKVGTIVTYIMSENIKNYEQFKEKVLKLPLAPFWYVSDGYEGQNLCEDFNRDYSMEEGEDAIFRAIDSITDYFLDGEVSINLKDLIKKYPKLDSILKQMYNSSKSLYDKLITKEEKNIKSYIVNEIESHLDDMEKELEDIYNRKASTDEKIAFSGFEQPYKIIKNAK